MGKSSWLFKNANWVLNSTDGSLFKSNIRSSQKLRRAEGVTFDFILCSIFLDVNASLLSSYFETNLIFPFSEWKIKQTKSCTPSLRFAVHNKLPKQRWKHCQRLSFLPQNDLRLAQSTIWHKQNSASEYIGFLGGPTDAHKCPHTPSFHLAAKKPRATVGVLLCNQVCPEWDIIDSSALLATFPSSWYF